MALANNEKKQEDEHEIQGRGRIKKLITAGFLLLLVLVSAVFITYKSVNDIAAFVPESMDEYYEVKDGYTAKRVVNDLSNNAFFHVFVDIYFYLNKDKAHIVKGPYVVDGSKSISEILSDMAVGNVAEDDPMIFTIVEGMTYLEVENKLKGFNARIDELKKKQPGNAKRFYYLKSSNLDAVSKPYEFLEQSLEDKELLQYFPTDLASLEGLLLPATYPFYKGEGYLDILARASNKMAYFLHENYERRDTSHCRLNSAYEVLILASLVERESSLDSERATVAGVFCNRLNKGMRLQTDPAVMYGVSPLFKGPLYRSQLKKDTPYNTYTRTGLPPTPIANPSEKSIAAVLFPDKTDAVYFVAKDVDPRKGHVFSATLDEHNRAVNEYRKKVKEYKRNNKDE